LDIDSVLVGAITHDERYYDHPERFMPERYLQHPLGIKEGVEDDPARKENQSFGGGRRVCPGISFANLTMVRVSPRRITLDLNSRLSFCFSTFLR
jgi:cytochrome P450